MENLTFLTFQKFSDKNAALELGALLDENKVDYYLEDASASLDSSFGASELNQEFRIKIKKEDFAKADELLIHASLKDLDAIDKDYYLFDFTDTELHDIIVKKDEWSAFDFLLAQKLLKDRGNEIHPEEVDSLRKQRLSDLAKPEPSQKTAIIAGYIFALLGGLFGIFIGWYLKTHKKTLPNGESVYNYSEHDRQHGNWILALGVFVLSFSVAFPIFKLLLNK